MNLENTRKKGTLIALCGLAGSGKSTVASLLPEDFFAMRFAGPLKDMLRSLGLDDRHIEGDLKEVPCDLLCGQTPRHAMVTLGTEWGRKLIGENIWSFVWKAEVCNQLEVGLSVVAEDLRFPNEHAAVRELGGVVVRVTRPGVEQGQHESEQHALLMDADFEIINDGSLDDLRLKVGWLLQAIEAGVIVSGKVVHQ